MARAVPAGGVYSIPWISYLDFRGSGHSVVKDTEGKEEVGRKGNKGKKSGRKR